jgi:hypothetical protein
MQRSGVTTMNDSRAREIFRRSFRAGSGYELVLFDRLPMDEQIALAELHADPDLYGVLKPAAESGHTVKVVGRDTALLLLTMQSPGTLPSYVFRDDPDAAARGITDLVLDGVLEIEHDGRFVAGPAAAELLLGGAAATAVGALAELSLAAVRYAAALALADPGALSNRLYSFHRQPLTPAWSRRLGDREAVLDFLGAAAGSRERRRLEADWKLSADGEVPGWIAFSARRERRGKGRRSYKLYVSPSIAALPETFHGVLAELGAWGAGNHFKVGTDAAGLLRPDKLVLYFSELDDLLAVASGLASRLSDVPVHGVPFTAEIAARGLLSWGMDPPRSERLLSWQEQGSWRLWVVQRLAAALIAARAASDTTMPAWQFALERLRREGIDVDRWTPSAAIWQAA